MANFIVSTKDDDAVCVDMLPPVEYEIKEWRRLHIVPQHLRENKKHIYGPVVLSLGPCHHGQLSFPQMDELKEEVYKYMLDYVGGDKVMGMFRQRIREKINDIRNFYKGASEDKYDDEALTEMMVHDACFVLYCMETTTGDRDKEYQVLYRLGMSGYVLMLRDFFLLDNQIPFCIIKPLINLKYVDNKGKGEELLYKFLSYANFGDDRLKHLPWKDDKEPPLHLLEARRAALVKEENGTTTGVLSSMGQKNSGSKGQKRSKSNSVFEVVNRPFRSVTDLKAKGIHFRQSSYCIRDIKFNSNGILQLPVLFVTNNTKVFFSNMIAFEMSPESEVDSTLLSYINFMKSLIQKPEDVKELREKDILFSRLGNDEEVVNIFKEIDAYGIDGNIFLEITMRINEHCKSKAKTWMAELIHSKFRNPWTAMALFGAICFLCLTFLQTYYTINPFKYN